MSGVKRGVSFQQPDCSPARNAIQLLLSNHLYAGAKASAEFASRVPGVPVGEGCTDHQVGQGQLLSMQQMRSRLASRRRTKGTARVATSLCTHP